MTLDIGHDGRHKGPANRLEELRRLGGDRRIVVASAFHTRGGRRPW